MLYEEGRLRSLWNRSHLCFPVTFRGQLLNGEAVCATTVGPDDAFGTDLARVLSTLVHDHAAISEGAEQLLRILAKRSREKREMK